MRIDNGSGAPRQMGAGTVRHLSLSVTIDETNLILEGLGHLPFARVYELVAGLQAQARAQVEPTPQPSGESVPPQPPPDVDAGHGALSERDALSEIALASGQR